MRIKRFKFQNQLESIDCGPACLTMICFSFGLKYTLNQIKQICNVTRMGVSVQDLINGSRLIGLNANGVKLTLNELEEVRLPIILFWKQDHFVVLYHIKKQRNGKLKYFIADPSYGEIQIESEMLVHEWMGTNSKGIAILIEKDDNINLSKVIPKDVQPDKILIKQVLAFINNNKFKYFTTILLLFFGLLSNWFLPLLFQKTIDEGIIAKSINIVWILLIAQFGLFLGNFISHLFSDLILTKLNFKLSILLKKNFLYKLLKLPINYFDTRINADTLQRLNDHVKIQNFLTWRGIEFLFNILNVIVFSVILFHFNKYVFLIFFTLSFISILWVSYFLKLRSILEYSLFLKQSENSNYLFEFIMNMPEIKISGSQNTVIKRILTIQDKLNYLELRSLFLNMYQIVGVNFISKLKELISIGFCAFLIINGKMSIGTLLSISFILGQLSTPILNFVNNIRDLQDTNIAHKRINEVYNESNEDQFELINQKIPSEIDSIIFSKVSFKYPGSFNPFVINNISLKILPNTITAIVGTSGSGKTTLMKLLLSYYKVNDGLILLNNSTNLSSINSEEWRNLCGTVLQDGHIFSTTIAQNIAIADEVIDNDKLIQSAKIACIHEFIIGLPMGYNTKIGSVGINLSGGQKQRILIARAVYKDPKFIFFDEATSSLDANNEQEIMKNLLTFFQGKTVIIIAHRLSTVKNADQILVLENGQICEFGNHDNLINIKGTYFNLIKNQLELGN